MLINLLVMTTIFSIIADLICERWVGKQAIGILFAQDKKNQVIYVLLRKLDVSWFWTFFTLIPWMVHITYINASDRTWTVYCILIIVGTIAYFLCDILIPQHTVDRVAKVCIAVVMFNIMLGNIR